MPQRISTTRLARRRRPVVDALERRDLPAVTLPAFLAAAGFGVTGKNSSIHANAVATSAAGDTVVTGSFRGTLAFNPTTSFTSANTQDAFVARYSPAGTLTWTRTFAGQATTTTSGSTTTTTYAVGQGSAVAIDGSGNIFVAGSFSGSVNFGTAATPTTLASPNCTEAFVARLDAAGNLAWARDAVGSSTGDDDPANALALDGQGGVVVAGTFGNALTIGATRLAAVGASEAFVARFDGVGNVTWAVASAGTAGSNAQALGVAVDSGGNVAVAGFYSGTVSLGSGPDSAKFTAQGSVDALAWKLNSSGGFLWGRSLGSTDYDSAGAIAVDSANNIYVTGTFSGSVDFGTGTQADVLTAGPIFDAFAVKFSSTGQESWARGFVGTGGWAKGQAVAVDPSGVVHVAGAFNGTVDFDPTAGVANLTNVGSTDAFVAGLTADGGFVYAMQAGQTNFNAALGIAVNAAGAVALAGDYSGAIAFGPVAVPSAGLASAFVARLQTEATRRPSAPVLQAASTTGATNVTSVTAPTFDVVAVEAADALTLFRDGVAVAARVGSGAIKDPGVVAQGVHQYTAVETSLAGVASAPSVATPVTILTTPPAAPTGLGLLAADDSGAVGDGLTNIRAPRVVGRATPGVTVQVLNAAGTTLGTAVAGADGSFTVQLAGLADGTYSLQAVAIDSAANRSAKGVAFSLRILSTPPAAPTGLGLLAADDSGAVGDGLTNVRAPRFTTAASAGFTVNLINSANQVLGTTTAAASGLTTVKIASGLADGAYPVRAVLVDAAGNVSTASATFNLVIDATPPPAPSAPSLLAADDSGKLNDGMTAARRPRITGVAVPGNRVDWVAADGVTVFATATAAAGTGSYTLQAAQAFPNGTVAVRVRQTDPAGNVSSPGTPFNLTIRAATGDYFGDSRTDVAIFRPSTATFYILRATTGSALIKSLGAAGDVPVAGDFLGDGVGEIALFRPSTAVYYLYNAVSGWTTAAQFGGSGDVPIPGDYDGDGKTDFAVYRPSTSTFYIQMSATNTLKVQQFGGAGDTPVVGDYFGTGHAQIGVYHLGSEVFYLDDLVTGASRAQQFGAPGDVPLAGDYDGDGKTDFAVYRPSTSTFYIQMSATNTLKVQPFGGAGDTPVVGDYFGAGRASVAVFRSGSAAYFFAADLTSGATLVQQWGTSGDVPTQRPLANNFALGMGSRSTLGVQLGVATPGGAVSPSRSSALTPPSRTIQALAAGLRIRPGRSVSSDDGRPAASRML